MKKKKKKDFVMSTDIHFGFNCVFSAFALICLNFKCYMFLTFYLHNIYMIFMIDTSMVFTYYVLGL